MITINSRRKINLTFSFLIVLFAIISVTFGTITSSAESAGNQETQTNKSPLNDLQNFEPISFLNKTGRLDFLKENYNPFATTLAITVTNTLDSGSGSLRQAIIDSPSGGTIDFNIPANASGCSGNVCTITLTTNELAISKSLTITGTGANNLIVQRSFATGTPLFRIFSISGVGIIVNINGITISNGSSVGGSIDKYNGGIQNVSSTLFLSNSIVRNNNSFNNGYIAVGGGIGNYTNGSVTISHSVIYNNKADSGGGGLYNDSNSVMTVINSTVSNNIGNFGGGITSYGSLTIINSTISNNKDENGGHCGGLSIAQGGTLKIINTIVALNSAWMEPDVCGSTNLDGTINSLGNNLIGNPIGSNFVNGVNGDKVGTSSNPLNPFLTPLQNNGGSTETHALLPNSPAKDSGNNCVVNNTCAVSLPNALTTDQRGTGYPRKVGSAVDIGAFEDNAVNPVTITSISPASPIASNIDQNVTVNGNNFEQNLTVDIIFPNGAGTTLSGTQIQNVTPNSFTMLATFNAAGTWQIKVRNQNGAVSNSFSFNVQQQSNSPSISSISPTTPTASGTDQNVTVNGTNFQPGLTATVTFPNGGNAVLSGTQIQNVTATSFTMRITLGNAGNWNLKVENPNGSPSNVFAFTVQSGVQPPVIFSINPTTPTASNTNQDVLVIGNNFQPNLSVSITFPSGGGTTLTGTQIQNVTATSFIMRATLNAAGNWAIQVNNNSGGQSSIFTFSVSGSVGNSTISSINPASPTANGADQNVIVNGSNFQNGLRVNVTFPNGGISTLQGTGQIQNVTANSFLMRITLNAAGSWNIRVVNPDNSQSQQFTFNVQAAGPPPTNLPTSVLSPVIGALRVTSSNQAINDGKWEFNQYKTGFHTPTGGISLSNDTFAWDINLYTPTSGNADAGKAVFAVASGEVVSYVGTPPGGGPGAVLIAHPNAANPVWFSGYLHMTNVRVTLNQQVDATTIIGEIGKMGTDNEHLHFVVYSGQNTRGNLRSFDTEITERQTNATNPPEISSIEPNNVPQSIDPKEITISGSNFQSNSVIEAQSPDGQKFIITPESVSGTSESAQILKTTSSSITAHVPFAFSGNYQFSVINRSTNTNLNAPENISYAVSGNCQKNCTVYSAPSGRTPVILIPGIMGSRLAKRESNYLHNIWLGGFLSYKDHQELAYNIENPSFYRDISQRQVVATELIRNISIGEVSVPTSDVYDRLISYLTSAEIGFTPYDVTDPNQRTIDKCDTNQVGADLFLFPYDWRNSNWTSARDLYEYIHCVARIRYKLGKNDPIPANFRVQIIAHSQGGLVAKRYILNNSDHYVERLVTLGTPWLGAPKVIKVMENGKYDPIINSIIDADTLMKIAPYIKGAHELIPSRAYDDLTADRGSFGEDGWNYNENSVYEYRYNFDTLKAEMNRRYPITKPGDTTDEFHKQIGQDNWWDKNDTGVAYYTFVGVGKNTIGSVIAKKYPWGKKDLVPVITDGDGTVPLISALRKGRKDYRGTIKPVKYFPLTHAGLASSYDPKGNTFSTFPSINCVVNVPDADTCIKNTPLTYGLKETEELTGNEPHYLLNVIGSESVTISDTFGNTTNPLSTSVDEGVRTVDTDITGDNYLSATFPLDQNYKVVIKTPTTPLSVILTKSDGQNINQAIRYVDITLPPNVLALIEITPQGVTDLKYDSNDDGTFDTQVDPTINIIGTDAQDITPPVVTVNETVQGATSQITLEATDEGTGVQKIMYSLDGTTFQQYSTALSLNPTQTPTIYAFADDNVANRSGLVTYNLGSATLSLSGIISYGTTPLNQAAKNVSDVTLSGSGNASVTAQSNSSGAYSFNSLAPGNYTVTPTKTGDVNGINSTDAVRIQQYIVGSVAFTPNQLAAADTSNNGVVNSTDALRIQQYIVQTPSNHIVGQWRFLPASKNYSSLSASLSGENYIAVLMGEVTGNWTPPASASSASFSEDEEPEFIKPGENNQPAQIGDKQKEKLLESISSPQAGITVTLPTNATSNNGTTINIPTDVSQLPALNAGNRVETYNFNLQFDPNILSSPAAMQNGTISAAPGGSLVSNSPQSGIFSVSYTNPNGITGQGTLLNIQFTVIGSANQQTALTFVGTSTSPAPFEFNEGDPAAMTNTGQFTVTGTTAAGVNLSGRVSNSSGRGIQNVVITMTDNLGNNRIARTTAFGYYHFNNVAAGETYIISAKAKRYTFAQPTLVINIGQDLTEINFTALP